MCVHNVNQQNVMSVSLEPVAPQEEIEEPAPTIVEEAPSPEEPPAPETIIQEANTSEEAAATPAPKKRGRPRKDPTVKAPAPKKAVRIKPPQPLTPESSDDDEPIDRDDMETLLLDDLIKRKRSQQDARRNMWAQIAGLR